MNVPLKTGALHEPAAAARVFFPLLSEGGGLARGVRSLVAPVHGPNACAKQKGALHERPRVAAFTLLEILIATVIFAIVLAAINGVFYGALRLRNKSVAAVEQALPMQYALAVIKRDLSNLVPGGVLASGLQTTPSMNNLPGQVSPDFYTATGLIDETSPWSEIQRVSYLLVDSPTNRSAGSDLVRAVSRNLLPPSLRDTPNQQWLMSGVQGLTFTYYDGTQWRESWDALTPDPLGGRTNLLPWAIKVQVRLAPPEEGRGNAWDAPIELVVPVVVQSRTNVAQSNSGGAS